MGPKKSIAFFIVIILFFSTALLLYVKPVGKIQVKEQGLASALSPIKNWQASGSVSLSDKVANSLSLDDYLYRNYRNGRQEVSLYVGYYFSAKKVGAAHDPLVCLPGQGWLVRQRGTGTLKVKSPDGSHNISYSTMLVERNGEQELFMYWFQTYDKAVAGTFAQKIAALMNKMQGLGQDNAFVRLSCRLNGQTEQQCMQAMDDFIRDFYPEFLRYIKSGA